jgi:hypothetical protein
MLISRGAIGMGMMITILWMTILASLRAAGRTATPGTLVGNAILNAISSPMLFMTLGFAQSVNS